MAEKLFAQFLLERGVIDTPALLDAIDQQRHVRFPLCALTLDNGLLTDAQLEQLDAEHSRSNRKVLEIAVKAGMVTFQQLEELAMLPADKRLFLAETLVRRGQLTLSRAQHLLHDHRQLYPRTAPIVDELFARIRGNQMILPFVRTTASMFLKYARQVLKIVSVSESSGDTSGQGYAFTQKLCGDREFYYILVLPDELVFTVASHILGVDGKTQATANLLDAVLEFVNVVVGNACAELSGQGINLRGEPSQVMTLDAMNLDLPRSGVAVKMQSAKGVFQVLLRFPDHAKAAGPGRQAGGGGA